MTYEFRLPDIGEGVAEGEVVRWLVKEGDLVKEDQPMVEVMTDKATVEIGSPRAGQCRKRNPAAETHHHGQDHERSPFDAQFGSSSQPDESYGSF